jgi:hypothetical protein
MHWWHCALAALLAFFSGFTLAAAIWSARSTYGAIKNPYERTRWYDRPK